MYIVHVHERSKVPISKPWGTLGNYHTVSYFIYMYILGKLSITKLMCISLYMHEIFMIL